MRMTAATLTPAERELYEERAAIREYLGGMDRAEAERAALADVLRMRQAPSYDSVESTRQADATR
jgi:hypothetical protein